MEVDALERGVLVLADPRWQSPRINNGRLR